MRRFEEHVPVPGRRTIGHAAVTTTRPPLEKRGRIDASRLALLETGQ